MNHTKAPVLRRGLLSGASIGPLFVSLACCLGCSGGSLGSAEEGTSGSSNGGGGPTAGSGGGSDGGNAGTGGGSPVVPTETTLPARTWRLSHEQYRKSTLDLVGVEPDLTNFKPETGNGKFENFSSTAFVRVDLAANYFKQAQAIAEDLPVSDLSSLTSCTLEASCVDTFINELGQRAFRSPVPPEVATRLVEIFELAQSEVDTETGFRAVVASILNSPLFLYRKEIGPSNDETSPGFSLTPYQVAEFLSFSLLDGPPPQWLTERAEANTLGADQLTEVIEQLMMEEEFQVQLRHFLSQWMEVDHFDNVEKQRESFPGFGLARPYMEDELVAFFEQSGQPSHGLANLLLDPVPSVNPTLDDFYYSDPSAPEEAERLGVLGLGTVLASHAKTYLTSPTLRGTFIRKRFFCQEITLPESFTPPPISETEVLGSAASTRELYEQHLTTPSCEPCHRLTDNIGFALESFDGAGRFRTEDSTQGPPVPLDMDTEITDSDVNRPLASPADLSRALAESEQVKECLSRQAFRFFFGQSEDSSADPPEAITQGSNRLTEQDSLGALTAGLLSTKNTLNRSRGTN